MLKLSTFAALALTLTGVAHAAPMVNQPFVTIGAGQATYKDSCNGYEASCDDSDSAFRIGAGFNLTPELTVELTYMDFGDTSISGGDLYYEESGKASVSSLALQVGSAVTIAPQVQVFGKIGAAFNKSELSYHYADAFENINISDDDTNVGFIMTAGGSYNIMPNLAATAQIDYLPSAFEFDDTDSLDVYSWSLGLKYQF